MRLLIYGINFAPELTGIGKYSGEMAEWFASRGHQVEVVTAPPYYPQWEVAAGYKNRLNREVWGSTGNIHVHRAPLWVPARVNGLTRLLHLFTFAVTSAPLLLWTMRRRPDVLFVVAPTMMTVPIGLIAGTFFRVPTWLHIQDFEVDAMLEMGVVPGAGIIARGALAFERFLMKRFKRVSSISTRMCERLIRKGVHSHRVVEFKNWVDLDSIFPVNGFNSYRKQLNIADDVTIVLYAGNLGEKQGLEVLIAAIRILSTRLDIQFVIAGDGAASARLQADSTDLMNIRWLSLQPLEKLNELLNLANIHVLPQRADAADLVMPSKLTGMLASGVATLGTAHADTQLGMVLECCGVRVEPGDASALADAIQTLADDPSRRAVLGQIGRQYAIEQMSRDAILTKAEAELESARA
jgi:colanic acid biosynthesis glycosyl transferase WcaI